MRVVFENKKTLKEGFPCTMSDDLLFGEAWNEAIREVAEVLNEELGTNLFSMRDWTRLERIAERFHIRFNENGEIVR